MHDALVNGLGGLSLPRKSVVRLTDYFSMTLNVYHGHKTTTTTYFIPNKYHIFFYFDQLKTIFKRYTEETMDPNLEKLNHRMTWLKIQNEVMKGLPLVSLNGYSHQTLLNLF